MYGLEYDMTCPYCGNAYHNWKGGTGYMKYKGHKCDTEYIEENCPHCGTMYWSLQMDQDVLSAFAAGKSPQEAKDIMRHRLEDAKEAFSGKRELSEQALQSIDEAVEAVYKIPVEHRNILRGGDLEKEVLENGTTIFW